MKEPWRTEVDSEHSARFHKERLNCSFEGQERRGTITCILTCRRQNHIYIIIYNLNDTLLRKQPDTSARRKVYKNMQ